MLGAQDRGYVIEGAGEVCSKPSAVSSWTRRLVEEDITAHSRPIMDLPLPLPANLAKMGVEKLFPVQAYVIEELLLSTHGPLLTCVGGDFPCDIVVCAPTGCGKTLAYAVPIVSALLKRHVPQVRALVVVPSQELATQVNQVFTALSQGSSLKSSVLTEKSVIIDPVSYPPASMLDILVTTPGHLDHHLPSLPLSSLRYLILDEADRLLQHSHSQWLPRLLTQHSPSPPSLSSLLHSLVSQPPLLPGEGQLNHPIKQASIPRFQKLLFSATMTFDPEHLAALHLQRPFLFSVTSADSAFVLPSQLEEFLVRSSVENKPLVLLHLLLQAPDSVLCFTSSKEVAHRLAMLLSELVTVSLVTAALSTGKRREELESFKKGHTKVMVCSDGMARGMDLSCVGTVINFGSPRTFGTYLHRAGRTARAGRKGVVYTLLSSHEVLFSYSIKNECSALESAIQLLQIHPFQTMLRKAGKNKLTELVVSQEDLQSHQEQYSQALHKLQQSNSS